MNTSLVLNTTVLILGAVGLSAQQVEVTPFIGGQWNGSIDFSTKNFHRVDLKNALVYGAAGGVSLSSVVLVEFMWNRSGTNLMGAPNTGGQDTKLFRVNMNQYFGNILFHFGKMEDRLRPFVMVGIGGTRLSPDVADTNSLTRVSFGFGGGVKYFFTKKVGLRAQWRWLPVNMYTTTSNIWCGPITGCWSTGTAHYLHSLDYTTGLTFRF